MATNKVVVLAQFCLGLLVMVGGEEFVSTRCTSINDNYLQLRSMFSTFNYSKRRFVDPLRGEDGFACLNDSSAFPCQTINYAVRGERTDNRSITVEDMEVTLLPGTHRLPYYLDLVSSSMIYLHGLVPEQTIVTCTRFPNEDFPCDFDNIGLTDSQLIWISNLTFTRCGPVSVPVYMQNVSNVIVENCVFKENAASPLLINDCDRTYFVGTSFVDNHLWRLSPVFADADCIGINRDLFFFSRVATSGGISLNNGPNPSQVLIKDCLFANNTARPNFAGENIPRRLRPIGRGGGLSVRFIGTVDGHLCLANTRFSDNRAEISAGGATLTTSREATNSSYSIENCVFENNRCETDLCIGGGLHYQTDGGNAYQSDVALYNTTFRNNLAGLGSGFVAFTFNNHEFSCMGCVFEGNVVQEEGSAVALLFFGNADGEGSAFTCWNCVFANNTHLGGVADKPAFYAHRINLYLFGSISFVNNTGGGISMTGGQVIVNGNATFINNRGIHGGAISLLSASQFFVKSGSNILFRGNLAKQFGGAIYATKPALGNTSPSLNRRCFFSYLSLLGVDFPPHEWDVQVVFQDNTALEKGPSIYSSNFVDCRFFGRDVALPNATFQRSIFNIPPEYVTPFVFLYENGTRITDQEELNKQMASDAYELSVTPQEMEVRLGEEATFSVQATDELLYPTSAVFTVDTNLDIEPLGTAGSPYYFRVGGGSVVHSLEEKCSSTPTDRVCGERITETIVFNVQLQPLLKERTLTISQCYPGYRYDAKSSTCICEHDRIFELLRCSGGNKEFYVTEGVWVGFFRNKTELVIRVVPLTYLRCQQLQPEFPGCLASIDHQEEQCATGREGLLCGECRSNEGYGITMDFKYCSTYGCTGGGIALFFIVCGLVVIFCCFILYFNIPVPNELRGFFLFAQVIGLVYRHSGALNDLSFIEFIANLMGNSLPFPLCMHPYINTTWMAALSYIPPLLAFLTVVGFIIGARYSTRLAQRSTFKGIIFIILFTYKYITDASFILMNCVNLPDDNNPGSQLWVSRFSGRACFGFPHLLWLIVALLLFVTVIVPTPLVMLLITCKHFNRTKHFSDALSKGFKRRARWFTAYDLLRRVYFVFFALWIPAIVLPNRVLSLAFFEIFMLVFHCLLLPYEKKWINMVEGLILVDLFVATVAILQPEDKYFPTGLIVVVIILPFLYALSASVYLISKYFWKRLSTKWRERITVQFGPLQHRWMKMKESFMQRESATAPPPEPIHATSMFYVNNTNDGELSASSGFDVPFSEIQDTNQYRTELNIS